MQPESSLGAKTDFFPGKNHPFCDYAANPSPASAGRFGFGRTRHRPRLANRRALAMPQGDGVSLPEVELATLGGGGANLLSTAITNNLACSTANAAFSGSMSSQV